MKRIFCVILAFVFAFGMSSYINNLAAVTNPGSVPAVATQEAAPVALSPSTVEEPAPLAEENKNVPAEPVQEIAAESPDSGDIFYEMINNVDKYSGQLYELDGILHNDGEEIYLGHMLESGKELYLPLRYMMKDIADKTMVRVTGVVSSDDSDGEKITVLDVVTIESI